MKRRSFSETERWNALYQTDSIFSGNQASCRRLRDRNAFTGTVSYRQARWYFHAQHDTVVGYAVQALLKRYALIGTHYLHSIKAIIVMWLARLVLLCASIVLCTSGSSLTEVTARAASYGRQKSCGYHGEMVKMFPLYAGNHISRVGTTSIKVNDKRVSMTFKLDKYCKIKKGSRISVAVVSIQSGLVPKHYPCMAKSMGRRSQTVTCRLSKFDFKCCRDMHFYTKLTLQCHGKTKPAFTGVKGCA
eukprot:IDg3818t1